MANTDQESIDDLQMRIAFLEQNQDELNDILTRQQAQITLMERALRHLSSRINEVGNAAVRGSEEESPPPHY
ncbi:MAG: SlyX family protein [Bermanella sp.]